jgi:hypothetical protein
MAVSGGASVGFSGVGGVVVLTGGGSGSHCVAGAFNAAVLGAGDVTWQMWGPA